MVLNPLEKVKHNMKSTPMKRFGKARQCYAATGPDEVSLLTGEEIIVDDGYATMTI